MNKKTEELSLEQAFLKMEETVLKLESADLSLEDSFQVYKEGIELLQFCNNKIDKVEKKVMVLEGNGEL